MLFRYAQDNGELGGITILNPSACVPAPPKPIPGEVMDWQPISTAPKDGTRKLLFAQDPDPRSEDDCGARMASHLLDVTTATYPSGNSAAPVGHGNFQTNGWLAGCRFRHLQPMLVRVR